MRCRSMTQHARDVLADTLHGSQDPRTYLPQKIRELLAQAEAHPGTVDVDDFVLDLLGAVAERSAWQFQPQREADYRRIEQIPELINALLFN